MAVARFAPLTALSVFLALSGVGLQSSCMKGTRVQAMVTTAPPACGPHGIGRAGTPRPIAGASISMMCPQLYKATGLSLFGRTDAEGELDFTEPALGRSLHDTCTIVVEKPGFQTLYFPVAGVCAEHEITRCVHVVVIARLPGPARCDAAPRSR